MDIRIDEFWIVWCPTGPHAPRVRHRTFDAATAEAKRLANENPGAEFYVLAAEGLMRKVDVEWVPSTRHIPF